VKKQEDGMQQARQGLIVRLFNVDGVDRNVTLSLNLPGLTLKGADRVNLIELEPEATAVSGNTIPLTLGHWAIETLSLSVI
jgi:alpha-mannosidase